MEKIKYYLEKNKTIIILVVVILVLTVSILYTLLRPSNKEEVIKTLEVKEEIKQEEIKIEKARVDIKGFVINPGVYEMNTNDRVIDVIQKAGGLKEDANTEYINLSKKVTDEMIIIIYSNNEVEKFKETEKEIIYIEYECICPDNINDTCITENDIVNTNGVKEKEKEESNETITNSKDNLISINNATLEELMTLSGIGQSKAQAIIDYREENGKFENLEDIMKVSGIGESAYSKIKDNIKL